MDYTKLKDPAEIAAAEQKFRPLDTPPGSMPFPDLETDMEYIKRRENQRRARQRRPRHGIEPWNEELVTLVENTVGQQYGRDARKYAVDACLIHIGRDEAPEGWVDPYADLDRPANQKK